ncbi:MAG TPA: muconolactone Delta-isomerase family protein [Sporichthyaceae bacterium]
MEFLIRTRLTRPESATDADVAAMMAAEKARGGELMDAGVIKRLWRVPGEWGAWVLYDCPDATTLHEALTSLPLYKWMKVEVHPLAVHPFDRG